MSNIDAIEASRQGIELWKDVPQYERYYQVSNLGRVRSKDRCTTNGRGQYMRQGRILRMSPDTYGYPKVHLQKDGKVWTVTVGLLVLLTFAKPKPLGAQVLHRDDVKSNNRLYNLYYGTAGHNRDDSRRNGTIAQGDKNGQSVLTEADIPAIRVALASGESCASIARRKGVWRSTIWAIKQGKRWEHVP